MPLIKQSVTNSAFRGDLSWLPFNLRRLDFESAMQDVYDFFHDINENLLGKGLRRFDDLARPQLLSGLLSDLLTDSVSKHSRNLVVNKQHNGHPDLLVGGVHAHDAVQNGLSSAGIEVKSTNKAGGAVDTHGARDQWMMVFVWQGDFASEPLTDRVPTKFVEIYCAEVQVSDFRSNSRRTDVGTRTATLDAAGVVKLRRGWVYLDLPDDVKARRLRGTGLI